MANRNAVPSPVLPLPPLDYDYQHMLTITRLLNYFIEQQDNPGNIKGATLNITNIPTSSTGLVSGDVWNDSGTLKIV